MAPRLRFITGGRIVDKDTAAHGGIKVICAGPFRCATSSLQAALEGPVIGISPCMHFADIAPHADRLKLVREAMIEMDNTMRRRELLATLFAGYAATTDFPGIQFVDDLMDMYPEACVVLNTRPIDDWAQSYQANIAFFGSSIYRYVCLLWETDRINYQMFCDSRRLNLSTKRFGGKPGMTYRESYTLYNNWVRKEAEKRGRRLLEWQVQDGYEPLCEFLGIPPPAHGSPEAVFPHVNDSRNMQVIQVMLLARGLLGWAVLGLIVCILWEFGGRKVLITSK